MKKICLALSSVLLALSMNGCFCGWDDSCYEDYWYEDDYWYYEEPWEPPCGGSCGSCGECSTPSDPGGTARPKDCVWNSDCSHGYSCVNSVCVLNPVPPEEPADPVDPPVTPTDPVCEDGFSYYEGACHATGGSCRFDKDCNPGYSCIDYVCLDVAECKSNSDCSDGDICTEGRCIPCQTSVCDPTQEVECVFSSDCESGLCADGKCLAPGACVLDSNCEEGQICKDGACIARPECLSDAECGEGRICNAGNTCEDDVECRQDSDCGEGLICISNMCAECRLSCECGEDAVCLNGACVAK